MYTKGPWKLNYTLLDGAIVRCHIAGPKWGSVYPICEHLFEGEPLATEQEANMNLIAAAPCLLEALQHVVANLSCDDYGNDCLLNTFDSSILEAAIAKATGG